MSRFLKNLEKLKVLEAGGYYSMPQVLSGRSYKSQNIVVQTLKKYELEVKLAQKKAKRPPNKP